MLAETVTKYQFWRIRYAFQARMCKQGGIQRPLNAFVQNTDKEVFKDETMLLIKIGQYHSISMHDKIIKFASLDS